MAKVIEDLKYISFLNGQVEILDKLSIYIDNLELISDHSIIDISNFIKQENARLITELNKLITNQ